MVSEREQQARERSAEVLEQAEATLALPRFKGALWTLPEPERRAEPPAPRKAAPAAAPAPVAYVTKAAFRQYQDGIEAAIARLVRQTEAVVLARSAWRTAEAERRIAELEARLARLEGRSHE